MANENLSVYDRICRTRKSGRATASDYINATITDFVELHGDRCFADDHAIVGGIGRLNGKPVTVIGIEKGRDLNERLLRNFGCVLPEGYRKALRLIKQAEKFHRPVICFVDTQGANCGKGAEERGQGQAIANNLYELTDVKTPIISVMIGEGGSGGALALAVADEVWMLENAYYSVITPESCASILFKDPKRAPEAAEHLKLTAADLNKMGIVEKVVEEPEDFSEEKETSHFMKKLADDLSKEIKQLEKKPVDKLLDDRYEKYRKIIYYTLTRFKFDEYTKEDLSHDIYIKLASHLDDIDINDSKKTQNYIITVTRNYSLNYLRSKSRKPESFLEDIPVLLTASEDILEHLINKEQVHWLAKEINKLDDIYKSVLELKYVNNFSNDEIASFLNLKKKTVEMRLYRANLILREKLKGQGDE